MKMFWALVMLCCWGNAIGKAEPPHLPEGNSRRKLIIVTLDGLRWQELFGGPDPVLLHKAGKDYNSVSRFSVAGKASGRQALMPFMWDVVSRQGVLLGNRHKGNRMDVANPYALSYAGYNELFTGAPDFRIWSNDPFDNPNYTVLEYLDGMPVYRGKVASFGSWGVFTHIFNRRRSRFFVDCGVAGHRQGAQAVRNDAETYSAALNYLRRHQPRVLHLGLGGTDEAAHAGNYPAYLQQAHLADSLIASLWQEVQRMDAYRNQTTLIITTDHGRGYGRHNWSRHGFFVAGSSQTWMALVGNGIRPLGELQDGRYRAGQLAGTIGYLMDAGRFGRHCLPLTLFTGSSAEMVAYR